MEKEGATKFKNQTLEEIDVDMHEIDSILEDDDKIEVCDTGSSFGMSNFHLLFKFMKMLLLL